MGYSVPSKDRMARAADRVAFYLARDALNPKDTSVHCLTVLEHGHTHEKFCFPRADCIFTF